MYTVFSKRFFHIRLPDDSAYYFFLHDNEKYSTRCPEDNQQKPSEMDYSMSRKGMLPTKMSI